MADTTPRDAAEPLACSPCRGTGRVFSNAGEIQHEVPCPWCEGTGITIPGHDAQAARRGDAEPSSVQPETD